MEQVVPDLFVSSVHSSRTVQVQAFFKRSNLSSLYLVVNPLYTDAYFLEGVLDLANCCVHQQLFCHSPEIFFVVFLAFF